MKPTAAHLAVLNTLPRWNNFVTVEHLESMYLASSYSISLGAPINDNFAIWCKLQRRG
jgi:hypothetical protein